VEGQNILNKAAATIQMNPTNFRTGSDGYRGQGKVMEGDAKYQVQVLAIRVGSKNGNGKAKAKKG